MKAVSIKIDDLKQFILSALWDDDELLLYYDKTANVTTLPEAINNVFDKIKTHYPHSILKGIEIDDKKAGFFAYCGELLISFGVNKEYRNSYYLSQFFEQIKTELGGEFTCLLYAHNKRAIGWLERCNMDVVCKNVTILRFNK
jgi:hypothetical protein